MNGFNPARNTERAKRDPESCGMARKEADWLLMNMDVMGMETFFESWWGNNDKEELWWAGHAEVSQVLAGEFSLPL